MVGEDDTSKGEQAAAAAVRYVSGGDKWRCGSSLMDPVKDTSWIAMGWWWCGC